MVTYPSKEAATIINLKLPENVMFWCEAYAS